MVRIYIFWIIGLFVLTFAGSKLLPLLPNSGLGAIGPGKDFNYALSLAQWDGGHFLEIAKSGYHNDRNFAFFPLYPLLIKLFSFVTLKNALLSAILLSNIFFVIFLYKLYEYSRNILSQKKAFSTTLTFLLFPTTFFCLVAYSESLFLLLSILMLEALTSERYLKASIFAALASLARFIGVALLATLIADYLAKSKNRKFNTREVSINVLSTTGILIFGFFSYLKTHDPVKFVTVQSLWQRGISDFVSTVFSYLWSILTLRPRPINDYLDLFLTITFFTLLMYGVKKIPFALWLFSLLALLIPTYSGTLTSMPRYLLSSIGVFLIIGDILEEKPSLKTPVWSVMLALQCLLAALFINGYWVA